MTFFFDSLEGGTRIFKVIISSLLGYKAVMHTANFRRKVRLVRLVCRIYCLLELN